MRVWKASKKLSPTLLVMTFALSTVLIAVPVQAHFTIGRPTGTLPYRVRDFDPHVPGPTGYVWPGSGVVTLSTAPNVGSGAPSPVTWGQGWMLPPGYQSPWSTNPLGAPTSWYQLAGNTYAPFGAILTSTEEHDNVGDLIFAINFTTTRKTTGMTTKETTALDYRYSSLIIYIPPEFTSPVEWTVGDTSNIITTITNQYGALSVWKADVKDPFGPGWWVIYINLLSFIDNGTPGINPRGILFSQHNSWNEWYYVRVNGMTAPKIAGRYVFKMFLDDSFPTMNVASNAGAINTNWAASTMAAENWPVLLVKGGS